MARVAVVEYAILHAVMKRSYDGDYLFYVANLVKKLPEPVRAHSVECFCEVDENSVKKLVLLDAFSWSCL